MYGINTVTAHPQNFVAALNNAPAHGNADGPTTTSYVDDMKNIAKARLQRQVMADPSLARELVAVEASAVYNSRGSLIAALSTRQITV